MEGRPVENKFFNKEMSTVDDRRGDLKLVGNEPVL